MFIYVRRNYLSDILQMNSGTRRATGLSGLGGVETYQDRAARCAHQAGVFGQAVGDRNAYVDSCINQ